VGPGGELLSAPRRLRGEAPPPVDLDDADAVLRLVDSAAAVPCARCRATGVDPQPFGTYSRACIDCNGTTVGGLAARRVIERHAVQVAATLARIVHRQRPGLPFGEVTS